MAPNTDSRFTRDLMLEAVPSSSPNIFATREIWSRGGTISEIIEVPLLQRSEHNHTRDVPPTCVCRTTTLACVAGPAKPRRIFTGASRVPSDVRCVCVWTHFPARLRAPHPRAASRVLMSFLIFHCSTALSPSSPSSTSTRFSSFSPSAISSCCCPRTAGLLFVVPPIRGKTPGCSGILHEFNHWLHTTV